MGFVGGLRYRLVCDSTFEMIRAALTGLGWFDVGRAHAPINLIPQPVDDDDQVPVNTLAVAPGPIDSSAAELGSDLEDHRLVFYADLYAEDDALGRHLSMDVVDILKGRFPAVGRDGPFVQVFDYTDQPTTPAIFTCEIENVISDGPVPHTTKAWQKHWFVVRFDVLDTYGSGG